MLSNVFGEIAAILALAALLGFVGVRLRQPLIVAFIAVGVLAGPAGLGWVRSTDQVALLVQMGSALLLFVVGLKLDLSLIRTMGPVALATGLGQVLFTVAVCTVPLREVGLTLLASLRAHDFGGLILLTAHNPTDAETFYAAGADYVLLPYADAAREATDILQALLLDADNLHRLRTRRRSDLVADVAERAPAAAGPAGGAQGEPLHRQWTEWGR